MKQFSGLCKLKMDSMETSTETLEVFVRPGETTAIVAIITMMAVIIALGSVGE